MATRKCPTCDGDTLIHIDRAAWGPIRDPHTRALIVLPGTGVTVRTVEPCPTCNEIGNIPFGKPTKDTNV